MRSCRLDEYDLPNIIVYEDGNVYDTVKGRYLSSPRDAHVVCSSYGGMIVKDFARKKLVRQCFKAPWKNGIKCVNLQPLGLSRYFATEDGRIFGTRNMDYISPRKVHDGYLAVHLYADNGDYMAWRVHRLIALAFIPNPEHKDTVDHINDDKTDNRVENLRWMWMWENIDHRRETHGGPSDEKIIEICKALEKGYRVSEVEKLTGTSRYTIRGIMDGDHYRISKDFDIPRTKQQRRLPIEFRKGITCEHGQSNRRHELPYDSSSTTIP